MSMDEILGWVDHPDGWRATLKADCTWSVPGREWSEDGLKLIYSDDYRGQPLP
jgi:hypothetical protein